MAEQYKAEPHSYYSFGKKTKVAHLYCGHCGFIYLKNELSEWVAKVGCNYREHPSYKNKLSITNPFI
jgi:hypothetical protein